VQQITLTQMIGISKEVDPPNCSDDDTLEEAATEECHRGSVIFETCQTKVDVAAKENTEKEGVEQDENDVVSVYVKERECEDIVSRVHRNATRKSDDCHPTDGSFSLWDAIAPMTQDGEVKTRNETGPKNERRICQWDDLFTLEAEDVNDEDFNDLLNLFDDHEDDDNEAHTKKSCELAINEEVSSLVLSQEAQAVAENIISSVGSKKDLLDRSCPNWKENILFALRQDDPEMIEQALENVQKSRQRMLEMRPTFLVAWERQNAALEIFETALEASASRMKARTRVIQIGET
jgi:hypothetical protein